MDTIDLLLKLPDDLFEYVMSFYETDERCFLLYYILNILCY